jgi:hypothetical protein
VDALRGTSFGLHHLKSSRLSLAGPGAGQAHFKSTVQGGGRRGRRLHGGRERSRTWGFLANRGGWKGYWADAFAARSIKRATSSGLETYTAWLAGTSIVSLAARLAMLRSRSGLMLWSRVATSAQLFF